MKHLILEIHTYITDLLVKARGKISNIFFFHLHLDAFFDSAHFLYLLSIVQ
jgi:hypothetical protein